MSRQALAAVRRVLLAAALFCAAPLVAAPAFAQVPMSVQVDLLNARLAQELEREDYRAMLGTLAELRKLDPNLSKDMLFMEAIALSRVGRSAEAKALLERYFKEVGQGGKYYSQALALYNTADRQAKAEAERAEAEKARREREAAARRAAAARAEEDRKKREAADKARREAAAREQKRQARSRANEQRFTDLFARHAYKTNLSVVRADSRATFEIAANGDVIVAHQLLQSGLGCSDNLSYVVRRYRRGSQLFNASVGCTYSATAHPALAEGAEGRTWVLTSFSGNVSTGEFFGPSSRHAYGHQLMLLGTDGKREAGPFLIENLAASSYLRNVEMAPAEDGGVWLFGYVRGDMKKPLLARYGRDGKQMFTYSPVLQSPASVELARPLPRKGGGVAIAYCAKFSGNTSELTVAELTASGTPFWQRRTAGACLDRGAPLATVPRQAMENGTQGDGVVLAGKSAARGMYHLYLAGRNTQLSSALVPNGWSSDSKVLIVPVTASGDRIVYTMRSAVIFGRLARPAPRGCAPEDENADGRPLCEIRAIMPWYRGSVAGKYSFNSVLFPRALRHLDDGSVIMAGAWLEPGRDYNKSENYGFFITRLGNGYMPISFNDRMVVMESAAAPAPVAAGKAPGGTQTAAAPSRSIGAVSAVRSQFGYAVVTLSGAKPAAGVKFYAMTVTGERIPLTPHTRKTKDANTILVTSPNLSALAAGASVFAE